MNPPHSYGNKLEYIHFCGEWRSDNMAVVVPQGDFDALHGQLEPLQQGNWEDMAYAMFEHDIAMMMNDIWWW